VPEFNCLLIPNVFICHVILRVRILIYENAQSNHACVLIALNNIFSLANHNITHSVVWRAIVKWQFTAVVYQIMAKVSVLTI